MNNNNNPDHTRLYLRKYKPTPLTHNELDSNQLFLEIIEWVPKSYDEGQFVLIREIPNLNQPEVFNLKLYYCLKTHTKNIYTNNTFIIIYNNERYWKELVSGGSSVNIDNLYIDEETNLVVVFNDGSIKKVYIGDVYQVVNLNSDVGYRNL